MRILFVINDIVCQGGTANSFLTILDNLPEAVEQPYVLMPGRGTLQKELTKRKIPVWIMDYHPAWTEGFFITIEDILKEWNNIKCAWDLSKRLKVHKIDIVYTNSGVIDVGAMAALFAGKKHIWHQREFIHKHFKKKYIVEWKERWLLRHSDMVVAISGCLLKELKRRYHIKNGIVFYNSFSRNRYYVKKQNWFSDHVMKCLVTGNIYEGKHQMDAVSAIGKLIRKYNIAVELYLAGWGDSEYINRIMAEVKTLGIQKEIHILRYEKDMKSLREKMDIEISCSQWEAFGRTVIEGMLGGLLVIGANSGATPELIKHNWNGLLYEPGNADDLAEKILWVCKHKAEAEKIAYRGQRRAEKYYSDDDFDKGLECILMSCF